ncbi:MAG TPA: cell division protein FtsL [Halanaerobiales bacterium]|nr:cell division protein FtsL [Halanaerobiales bacterium]
MLQAKVKKEYNYSYLNDKNNSKESSNKDRTKTIILAVLLLILIIGSLVLYLTQLFEINQLNYSLKSLRAELTEKQEELSLLNIELAQNTSLMRIEKIARNHLNMVEPEKVEIIVLNKEYNDNMEFVEGNNRFLSIGNIFTNLLNRFNTVKAGELE